MFSSRCTNLCATKVLGVAADQASRISSPASRSRSTTIIPAGTPSAFARYTKASKRAPRARSRGRWWLHGLREGGGFRSYSDRIATPGDGQIIFLAMQAHTAESLKSLEGYHCAWVEQAEMLSQKSLDILRPTIREPNS